MLQINAGIDRFTLRNESKLETTNENLYNEGARPLCAINLKMLRKLTRVCALIGSVFIIIT